MAENKSSFGTGATVGLIGAVIGAAAGAAAVVLSDDKNRLKVQKAADRLQKEGGKRLDELKEMAQKFLQETEKGKAAVQKKLSKGKKKSTKS